MSNEGKTISEGERYYDEHVAPVLAQLAKDCAERGMHIMAYVEYEPGARGLTCARSGEPSAAFLIAEAAARANGNIDSLMITVMRHASVHGHSSVVLKTLGVPETPPASPEGAVH